MTSFDEIFQKSGVLNKRKLEPLRDPNEIYKSAKRSGSGSSARRALVEDADDTGNDTGNDDTEAGPALPPADDEGDDDEGRFFGSGVSAAFNDIIEYLDEEDEGGEGADGRARREGGNEAPLAAEKYDRAWVRRTVLSFERRINRNAEQRARYAAEPARFIESEAELDTQLKELSLLGEHPELYDEFVRLGAVASLVSLMAHENTDIAISAIEIIGELTDEDVDATDEQWNVLVDALLDADLVGLLVSNLARLNEDADEADRLGVYYAMGIVENLCSSRGSDGEEHKQAKQKEKRNGKKDEEDDEDDEKDKANDASGGTRAASALGTDKALIAWLLQRASRRDTRTGAPAVSQNRQYAAEILAILVQAAPTNRRQLLAQNGVDAMLQLVAPYRRRDPEKGSDEEEFMEDLFEALTCLVDEAEGKTQFAEAEGVELCLLLLQDGKKSRMPALRLLDHAAGGAALEAAGDVCRRIVDAGGLKTLFTLFMRGDEHKDKKHKKDKKDKKTTLHAGPVAEHLLGIMASMLRLLSADSAERIRLLAKFVEKDYAKVEQLMALRREYGARVATTEQQLAADAVDDEDERLARRLDAGLFTVQTMDVILAWLVAEDAGARRTIRAALAERDETLQTLRASLQERREGIDAEVADGQDMRDMLETLMVFLE